MKQFFKMFFASMLAMIVMGVIVFGVIIGMVVSAVSKASTDDLAPKISDNSVLVIDLSKEMHEQGQKNTLGIFDDGDTYASGLYETTRALDAAKTDSRVKAVLLKLSSTPNGWATTEQLRVSLENFKKSGKKVYAYGENISQGSYYVAAAADSLYLNPVGSMELKGFATMMPYFKGTLDKLELKPEIFYAGKFKSATEPFRSDRMSDANKLQITEFQKDFWNEFIDAVSKRTHADVATINQWVAEGKIQFPQDALDNKLVDGLLYWDQVEQRMRNGSGLGNDIKYLSFNDYAKHVKNNRKTSKTKIAVLFAEGDITDGESNEDYEVASKDFVSAIRKLRKNDDVKAVVLRVNSPGGSALASEVILRELQLLKEKKPLIVSMGNVAASGGYYIASQADSIFAMPNTITGSIGVFTMMFDASGLMKNKLGITFDGVKNAPYADFPTGSRPFTADESARMQKQVDHTYDIFKQRVARGRKMDVAIVDSIAQGRVWSGTAAQRIGLVDVLGNLDRAIVSAAAMAKVKDYQVAVYPEMKDKFEAIFKRLKGGDASEAAIKTVMQHEMGEDYGIIKQLRNLRNINGKAMMLMPFHLKTN